MGRLRIRADLVRVGVPEPLLQQACARRVRTGRGVAGAGCAKQVRVAVERTVVELDRQCRRSGHRYARGLCRHKPLRRGRARLKRQLVALLAGGRRLLGQHLADRRGQTRIDKYRFRRRAVIDDGHRHGHRRAGRKHGACAVRQAGSRGRHLVEGDRAGEGLGDLVTHDRLDKIDHQRPHARDRVGGVGSQRLAVAADPLVLPETHGDALRIDQVGAHCVSEVVGERDVGGDRAGSGRHVEAVVRHLPGHAAPPVAPGQHAAERAALGHVHQAAQGHRDGALLLPEIGVGAGAGRADHHRPGRIARGRRRGCVHLHRLALARRQAERSG